MRPISCVAVLTLAVAATSLPAQPIPATPAQQASGNVQLELRTAEGRTAFHRGEIIPIELTFSSVEHGKYPAGGRECFPHSTYRYHVDPPAFIDRVIEVDAGMSVSELTCGGPIGMTIDLAETPVKIKQILNDRFRMVTPGKYRISVTANKFGVSATSNTVEIEILPSDPVWEKAELARAVALMDSGQQNSWEGCSILRYLGTDAADLEMARRYSGRRSCDQVFESGIIAAPNRKDVLDVLESALRAPDKPVTPMYVRVLAFVSLYQQHPDWYPPVPTPQEQDNPEFVHMQRGELWRQGPAIQGEELRYLKLLAVALPQKNPEARAICMLTLLNRGGAMSPFDLPEEIRKSVRDQLPGIFLKLPEADRGLALQSVWPEIRSAALVPALKEILANEPLNGPNPNNLALRRLYELSPSDARPIILHALRSEYPHFGVRVLGLLPEKELPELDAIMLDRLKLARSDHYLIVATGLLQRYASPAIASSVRPFMELQLGHPECEAEANLFAYFLRVDPQYGARILHQEMQTPDRPGCQLLRRLAAVRMSPEVEQEALEKLNDPNPRVIEDALLVLREHGSAKSKEPILEQFRTRHDRWQKQAKEPAGRVVDSQADLDRAYLDALGGTQSWLSSKEDWQAFRGFCITDDCRQRVDQQLIAGTFNYHGHDSYSIAMYDPVFPDEFDERFGVGNCVVAGIDQLKEKLAQFPGGSSFLLDARDKSPSAVNRIYEVLQPWALQHGFTLDVYR